MRNKKHCDGECTPRIFECVVKIRPRYCIECTEWLVEKNHAGARGQGTRERDALALAARKFMRKPVAECSRGHSNHVEGVSRKNVCVFKSKEVWHKRDVSQHAPVWQKSAILRHVTDVSTQDGDRFGADIFATNQHMPGIGLNHPVEAAQQRRLPRAALADKRQSRPGRDFDASTVERDDVAVAEDYVSRGQGPRDFPGI